MASSSQNEHVVEGGEVQNEEKKTLVVIQLGNGEIIEIKDKRVLAELKIIAEAVEQSDDAPEPKMISLAACDSFAAKFVIENVLRFKEAIAGENRRAIFLEAAEGLSDQQLMANLRVADFLYCDPVIEGAACAIAFALDNCEREKVATFFDIPQEQDLTPQQIASIEEENNWFRDPRSELFLHHF